MSYAERLVLRDVSAHVSRGAFACLLGPSGCGKTTLLRAIAGFEPPAKGCIRIGECEVAKPGFSLPPERRRVGMVFQENALFPHLTVAGNVAFGLRREAPRVREATVHELLDVVGLEGLSRRYAHELSGGQQQRVALARALAPKPDVLLLDEPFSSLDTELRERIGIQVRDVLKAREVTTLLVTHDQSEAFALSDHIGVMREGSILQWDSAYNLYHEPANRFVADFVGQGAFVHGRMLGPDTIETELGVLTGNRAYDWPLGCEVDVLLRPDDIQPDPNAEITATIIERAFKGAEILYYLKLSTGSLVLSLFPSHLDHRTGESVGIRVCPDHLVAFRV